MNKQILKKFNLNLDTNFKKIEELFKKNNSKV